MVIVAGYIVVDPKQRETWVSRGVSMPGTTPSRHSTGRTKAAFGRDSPTKEIKADSVGWDAMIDQHFPHGSGTGFEECAAA
jgi:hypothetical protein